MPTAVEAPQFILNLDLCTLAYQLYHQSLILPLDPWFDLTAAPGSDRRVNVCNFTYEYAKKLGTVPPGNKDPGKGYYSGTAGSRGWTGGNPKLDPIITNYVQINPRLPMVTRDGEKFLAALSPPYVVDNIGQVDFARYTSKPTTFPNHNTEVFSICDFPEGKDHLIGFEGGLGLSGQDEPLWSMMGYVLYRKTAAGYDCHIAFRGSRSGAALGRTITQAQGLVGTARGNADWITDLLMTAQITDRKISKTGKMTKGFGLAIPTMFGTIKAACKRLQTVYGAAPQNIYVTGHSLGAALATQFTSACVIGEFGDELRRDLPTWPWPKAQLFAYAQPIPGDHTWAAAFNIWSSAQSIWVDGDSVVAATQKPGLSKLVEHGHHVGANIKLDKVAGRKENPHELFIIRGALLRDAVAVRPLPPEITSVTSWAGYENFAKMLSGDAFTYIYPAAARANIITEQNLRSVLVGCRFSLEFDGWLEEVYTKMISDKSSYKGMKRQKTLEERRKQVLQAIARMRALTPAANHAEALQNLDNDLSEIKDELGSEIEEQFICLGMILNYYQKTTLTLAELNTKPSIKKCLESKFGLKSKKFVKTKTQRL